MGELTSASGRANTVVQIQAGMQVQPVVFVTSAGAFVNVGTATTIPAGSYTLAYGTAWSFGSAGQPTLGTAVTNVDILGFVYNASLGTWCYLGAALGY